jgi:hypothetical protein
MRKNVELVFIFLVGLVRKTLVILQEAGIGFQAKPVCLGRIKNFVITEVIGTNKFFTNIISTFGNRKLFER